VQIIGRALRTAEGKDHALILDHTDTTSRLGFVTDIHHEHLSQGKLDSTQKHVPRPVLPKPCPKCTALMPAGVKVCPECGHERKAPESKIIEREGRLVEWDYQFRKPKYPKAIDEPIIYTYEEKARFYAQLRGYGIARNFKPGWAKLKYREKFNGVWPEWAWERHHPLPPGPEVMMFIKSRFIAWANDPRNPNYRPRSA